MPTTITRPDGTRSTYTNITPASWVALEKIKPLKKAPRAKGEKRRYPQWIESWSTRQYIDAYFELNTGRREGINAYPHHADQAHLALYAPLPDKPASWAPDTVEVEVLE